MIHQDDIFAKVRALFDQPVMQNNLRALWVEAMIAQALQPDWRHSGIDWNPWDFEHANGTRMELRQSAQKQSWGTSVSSPRYDIAARVAQLENGRYSRKDEPKRAADIYVFAWHAGTDQRVPDQWDFYVKRAQDLPAGQKSMSLRKLSLNTTAIKIGQLKVTLAKV